MVPESVVKFHLIRK